MESIKLKVASMENIAGVLALQDKYLLSNTPLAARAGGFVTTPFSESQIEIVVNLGELFIAQRGEKTVGYAFAGAWDFWAQWAIFPFMETRLPHLSFENTRLTRQNTFQYGPVCIDESERGTGLFPQLFEKMRLEMQPKYEIGITFINQINRRSFDAHTKKLGMNVIDRFHFNQNNYYGLAFLTNKSVLNR